MYNYIVYMCACNISIWLPILCLLPNPFEFIPIGKFRIYIMDCRDWFFFGVCVCVLLQKSVLSVFLLCTKNNILYKTIPSTFVVKPELNLAYYSAYKLQLGKPSPKIKLQLGKDHSQSLTVYADSYVRKRGLMKWR